MENKLIIIVCLFGILSSVSCQNNLFVGTVGNKTIYYNDIPVSDFLLLYKKYNLIISI